LTFKTGGTTVIPIGTKHRFFNPRRRRPSGFWARSCLHVRVSKIVYRLAGEGEYDAQGLPKSYMHFCLMADLGDMRWPGMLAMVNPLIQAVAAHARWSGEGERLLNKYWY
jgi:hypothetical protein